MTTHEIELPPLPPLYIAPSVEPVDYPEVAQALMDYARAAVEADRQARVSRGSVLLGITTHKEIKMEERIYMATIQHGYGDRLKEWETHLRAPDIFRAAEILKTDCEQRGWHVIAIEEVDYE